jgi:hypothetical protein
MIGKYPSVKIESKLVLPQEPSPMMTSFLGGKGQHSATAQITEINLKDLRKGWIHWAMGIYFRKFWVTLHTSARPFRLFCRVRPVWPLQQLMNNTAGRMMPAAAPRIDRSNWRRYRRKLG